MGQSQVILLDTHVVLWLTDGPRQAIGESQVGHRRCTQEWGRSGNFRYHLLELAMLASKGRIRLGISLESFLQEVEGRFVVLPISGRACARAMELPTAYPKDPADRIIGATALVEGLSLISADREIQRSKVVDTIW